MPTAYCLATFFHNISSAFSSIKRLENIFYRQFATVLQRCLTLMKCAESCLQDGQLEAHFKFNSLYLTKPCLLRKYQPIFLENGWNPTKNGPVNSISSLAIRRFFYARGGVDLGRLRTWGRFFGFIAKKAYRFSSSKATFVFIQNLLTSLIQVST